MKYLLGIDLSTTGAKALLVTLQGKVAWSTSTDIPLSTPKPLWSEQNPLDWWNATCSSIRQVLKDSHSTGADVIAIGLTGQMHGLTLLNSKNDVLRPAILWNDQRTGAQCDSIRTLVGKQNLIAISGNDALTGFTAPKILWVRENEPDIYANIAHILLPKDYIRFRLSNDYAVDKADGSGTILFNLKNRDWSSEIIDALQIPLEWLPATFEGTERTGVLSVEAAADTGLNAGTPIFGGGGDQAAQAVGVGAVTPGIVALTLGTSGVVFTTTKDPIVEPEGRLHAFCHSIPNRWHLMGVMLSAAGSLRWYRDTFAPSMTFDELLSPAVSIPSGSEGLLFLPYLTGERTPYPDPLARGAFVGLNIRHSMAHLTRSVLEGVAFGLLDSFELMKSSGSTQVNQVRVSGGGAKSPLWRQILADVFNAELVTINTTEGAAYGAALLAGVGVGVWADVDEACNQTIEITGRTIPNEKAVASYQMYYKIYKDLYPSLKSISHSLSVENQGEK